MNNFRDQKASRKNSKVNQPESSKQASAAAANKTPGKDKSMYHLFQSLAPEQPANQAEESLSEDEDASKLVDRRTSINIENVLNVDFEHYNKIKPPQPIKLKIKNLVMEFIQGADQEHASVEFTEICQQEQIEPFMVAGYILNNGFSHDQNNWNRIVSLVVDTLFQQERSLTGPHLVESLNVAIANFVDTIIDYPNSKIYIEQLFLRLKEFDLLTTKQLQNYRLHIENLEKQAYYVDDDEQETN